MIKIVERTELSEETIGYEIQIDSTELDTQETLDDRYERYVSMNGDLA